MDHCTMLLYEINLFITILKNKLLVPQAFGFPDFKINFIS
jgi:hypothetical protein